MKYFLYCLQHYADFNGRARRSEFWYYTLFHFLFVFLPIFIGLILLLAGGAFQDYSTPETPSALTILGALLSFVGIIACIGLLVPTWAVTARRLHDTGKSGWLMLIGMIPYVNVITGIVLLVFYCTDSTPGDNQYGPNPKDLGNNGNNWGNPYGQGAPYGYQQPYNGGYPNQQPYNGGYPNQQPYNGGYPNQQPYNGGYPNQQ